MSRGHRPIEHTADTGVEAWAPDLAGLFEECALGMFEVMYAVPSTEPSVAVTAHGRSLEELLVAWLSELLYVSEVWGLAVGAVAVDAVTDGEVRGRAGGIPVLAAEVVGPPVKAVTFHALEVMHADGWRARAILDV
jgi:SHS2 domain-containing protein